MCLFMWWTWILVLTSGTVLGDAPYPPSNEIPIPYTSYSEPPGFGVQTGYEGYLVAQPEDGETEAEDVSVLGVVNELLGLFGAGSASSEKEVAAAASLLRPRPSWLLLPLLKKFALPLKLLLKFALWLFAPLSLVLLGGALTVGVCAFTPVCTLSILGLGLSRDNVRSLITPDRLASISTFVQDAIHKYQGLQKKGLKKERQMRKVAKTAAEEKKIEAKEKEATNRK